MTSVTGTDPDASTTFGYSIVGGADSALFTINSTTGALSFASGRDFENAADAGGNNVYDVRVQISDGLGGVDEQDIAITITDANDAPDITSNGGGLTATIGIVENTTAVTTITATDQDVAPTITYSITGGADFAKFTINSTTGALEFVSAPDFENPTDAGGNNTY
ncbi:MAG: cadherin repeat domain-containing protein, partial [Bosea sp. (in: a-proteobacteria)]